MCGLAPRGRVFLGLISGLKEAKKTLKGGYYTQLELPVKARLSEDKEKVSLIDEIIKENQAAKAEAEAERMERYEIRELEKLKLMTSNREMPNFSGALSLFKSSLAQSGINAPAKHILDTLVRRFPMQLSVVAGDVEGARNLYEEMKALPSTTTTARVTDPSQWSR